MWINYTGSIPLDWIVYTEILKCAAPGAPDNGGVTVEGDDLGDAATYTCDAGYNLVGTTTATCTEAADGESASFMPAPPVCESKPHVVLLTIAPQWIMCVNALTSAYYIFCIVVQFLCVLEFFRQSLYSMRLPRVCGQHPSTWVTDQIKVSVKKYSYYVVLHSELYNMHRNIEVCWSWRSW